MKHRSYIFLISIVIIFIALGYFLMYDNKPKHELEITFLLESPIVEYGEKLPNEIVPLVKVFESNPKELFYPKIVVKRLDRENTPFKEIEITKKIKTDLSYNDVKKHIDKNISDEEASPLMYLESENNSIDYKDTIGFLTFYLLKPGYDGVDNLKYFDDAKRLSKHIDNLLEDDYFENNRHHASNAVKIIIPKEGIVKKSTTVKPKQNPPSRQSHPASDQPISVSTEKSDQSSGSSSSPASKTTTKQESPVIKEKIIINLNLNENTNLLSWNNKLKDIASEIKIVLTLKKPSGNKVFNFDATGMSSYLFDPNNSEFSGNEVDIKTIFTINNDKYILNGKNTLFGKELKCSAY